MILCPAQNQVKEHRRRVKDEGASCEDYLPRDYLPRDYSGDRRLALIYTSVAEGRANRRGNRLRAAT